MLFLLLACSGTSPSDTTPTDSDRPVETADTTVDSVAPETAAVTVTVTLDEQPVAGASVMQGGSPARWTTDGAGQVEVLLDLGLPSPTIIASHPDARTQGQPWYSGAEVTLTLARFSTSDNLDYVFQDPGEVDRRETSDLCSHCHVTLVDEYRKSPHATAASNPVLHDLYSGAAAAWVDAASCASQGGEWASGRLPGGDQGERCYTGEGVVPLLNSCDSADCEEPENTGACADCHAPGIDGAFGGRDLLDATGVSHDAGVHCDVCHKVESVDLDAAPGVGGRLKILRPSEASSNPLIGEWEPLTFGPYDDVLNPRMGSVQRDHYREATLCAGCHEQRQEALVPDTSVDTTRWADGTFPVHSTYSEWLAGPMSPSVVCQSCHMPANAEVGNSADLGNEFDIPPGAAGGWYREPGEVRSHSWIGPRQRGSNMLELAAHVALDRSLDGDQLTVEATVKNVGPGHAIPTGEPLRSILLRVDVTCDGVSQPAVGGDVIPDYGGAWMRQDGTGDWSVWPGAQIGQVIRVVDVGDWVDYSGVEPFDTEFSVEAKGIRQEQLLGQATIVSVSGDTVTLDQTLPPGDVAYLGDAELPADTQAAVAQAGAPGAGFARVLTGADGARMVPHFMAVDVASDNRLMPQASASSEHRFQVGCEAPEIHAVLVHRAYPLELSQERGWDVSDSVMQEVRK